VNKAVRYACVNGSTGELVNVSLDASIAKLFVSESLVSAARDTVQIHGGYGCMFEYEVERALRDAMASTLYSGTSEMQRMAGFVRV
jgi:alkylation response protein AidB-like acyl-CoA dehydrogenase